MDTYVDILAVEYTVLKKEDDLLLMEKRRCVSELAALKAEMECMGRELDSAEASWASGVMGECEAETREHLQKDFSFRDGNP